MWKRLNNFETSKLNKQQELIKAAMYGAVFGIILGLPLWIWPGVMSFDPPRTGLISLLSCIYLLLVLFAAEALDGVLSFFRNYTIDGRLALTLFFVFVSMAIFTLERWVTIKMNRKNVLLVYLSFFALLLSCGIFFFLMIAGIVQ